MERHLGRIEPQAGHWGFEREGTRLQILAFRGRPRRGATTLCSLGLSHHELCSPTGHVRQELLVACADQFANDRLARLLPCAADYALVGHTALVPGQVLGPAGPLLPGSDFQALLCLQPFLHAEALFLCRETEPPTEFLWLVPIVPGEAREVASSGVGPLLERWDRDGVDLLDWTRRA